MLLGVMLAATPARTASPCDTSALTRMLADVTAGPLVVDHAHKGPVVVRFGSEEKPPTDAYVMLFHDDDVHTTFQSRRRNHAEANRLRQQLDRMVDRGLIRTWLSRCTTSATPADLGRTLDAAMRSRKARSEAPPRPPAPNERSALKQNRSPLVVTYAVVLPLLWLVLGIVLTLRWLSALRHLRSETGVALLFLTLLGAALRTFSAVEGPGDVFNNLTDFFSGPNSTDFGMYGMGIPSLLWGFEDLGWSVTDRLLMTCSRVAGVITIPLLYALARSLKRSRMEAFAAATMLALLPLHVQFSALIHRYILLVMLAVAACLLTVQFLDDAPGTRVSSGLGALAALTLGMLARPEAIALGPLVLSVTWVINPSSRFARRRAIGLVVATSAIALYPATASLSAALDVMPEAYVSGARPLFDPAHSSWFNATLSPRIWMVLSMVGLLIANAGDRRYVAWLTTAGLGWLWLTTTHPIDSHSVIYSRHQLGAAPFLVLLAALGLTRVIRHVSPLAGAGLAVFAMLGAVTPLQHLVTPTALSQEYVFMDEALEQIPKTCAIVAYETDRDTTLRRPMGLGIQHGLDRAAWTSNIPDTGCVAWLRTAACSAIEETSSAQRRAQLCTAPDPAVFETLIERRLSPHPTEHVIFAEGGQDIRVGLYLRR